MILLACILAGVLLYTEYRLTAGNMAVSWNGYGSIPGVLRGNALAPMQYRVLIPWLYALLPFGKGRARYLMIKGLGMAFALYAFGLFVTAWSLPSWVAMFCLAAVLPMMFLFDYADCYYEFGFLALAMYIATQGQQGLPLLVPIAFLSALNRETAVAIPAGYYALTGGIVGAAFLAGVVITGLLIPRIWYGRKGRYCSWMMFRRNFGDLRRHFAVEHLWFFLLLTVWGAMILPLSGTPFLSLHLVLGGLMAVLLVPSVWAETRVFMPGLLTIIPAMMLIF